MRVHPNATTDILDASEESSSSSVPHEIRTDRLRFRRVHRGETDFDRLHALFADAEDPDEVFAQCGWDAHESEDETREYLDDRTERWERGEFFEYGLESIPDGEFVGTTCLEMHDDGTGEFGLWLRKPYWGRELGSEVTDALVHVAVECLHAPFVTIGCRASNDKSRRAIEKFVRRYGGTYYGSSPTVQNSGGESDADHDAEPSPNAEETSVAVHHEWVLTREQFRSGESGISSFVPGVEYDDVTFDRE